MTLLLIVVGAVAIDAVAWRIGYVRSDDTGVGRRIDANLTAISVNVVLCLVGSLFLLVRALA